MDFVHVVYFGGDGFCVQANLMNGHVHSSPQSQSMQSNQAVNEQRIDGTYLTEMVQNATALPPSTGDMLHSAGNRTALTGNPSMRLVSNNDPLSVDRNPATNSGSACLQYTTYPPISSTPASATSVTQLSVPVPAASLITVPATVPLLIRQSESNSNTIRQTSSPRLIHDSSGNGANNILQNVHVQSSVSLPLQMGVGSNTKYFVTSSQPPSASLPISITSNPNFINIQQMPFQTTGNSPNHACADLPPANRIKIEEGPPQISQQQLDSQQQMLSYQTCENDLERGGGGGGSGMSLRRPAVQIAQFSVLESNMHSGAGDSVSAVNSVAVINNMPHVLHRATQQLLPPPRIRSVTPVNEGDASSLSSNR